MGLIDCRKHGYTGFAWNISKDISSRILNDFPMSVEEVVKVKVALYDEKELLGDIEYLVSLNIKNRLNLKDTYSISTDDESDQLGQLIHQELGGICADCLKEYKEKHGWHL